MVLFYKCPISKNLWGRFLICILFLLFLRTASVEGGAPPDSMGAVQVGDEFCTGCHCDSTRELFKKNVHARLAVGGENTCEACHGPGSKHVEEGDTTLIHNPATDYSVGGKNYCIDCHKGNDFTSWEGSAHYETGEGCSDCHTIHSEAKQSLVREEPELCFGCHAEKRAQLRMPSHHPVMEGFILCSNCHSVHGDKAEFTVGDEGRELCLSCHSVFQGPFIFEHEPVNEDCGVCHDPHGTVADKLLLQNEPFLCLSCHPMHFHVTLLGFEGEFEAPMHPERGGVSTRDGMKEALLTKCTQCHSEVHGSDLPSQSISGRGRALTR